MFIREQCCDVFLLDFFGDECTEKAVEECSKFGADVPLSDKFDSTAFEYYCK